MSQLINKVEVNGRTFEFVRITPNSQAKILKKSRIGFAELLASKIDVKRKLGIRVSAWEASFLAKAQRSQSVRDWKRTRSVAFKRGFVWRMFKIVPRQLWASRVDLNKAGELQASFFAYWQEIAQEYNSHLRSATSSLTPKAQADSKA